MKTLEVLGPHFWLAFFPSGILGFVVRPCDPRTDASDHVFVLSICLLLFLVVVVDLLHLLLFLLLLLLIVLPVVVVVVVVAVLVQNSGKW